MAEYIPGLDFQAAIEKCELCQEEDAQFYCKDCREEMCSGCKTAHIKSKVSCNHNVVSCNLGKSNRKERKTIKCTSHPREIIRMYCTNCDEAVCVKCISGTKHKKHNFDELETTLYKYQEEISQSMAETKQQIAELERSLQDIDVNVKDYTEVSDKTINEINKQRNQIKSDADKIADGLVDKVQKQKQQDLQLKEKEKKDVQNRLHDHNEYLQSCEGTLKSMTKFKQIQNKKPTSNPPFITRVYPQTFVSHDSKNLQEMFGQLAHFPETKSTQKALKQEKDQKKKPKSDDSVAITLKTVISTDIVTKINPGIKCLRVSAVNDKEAWCGGGTDLVLIDIHGQVQRKIKMNNSLMSVAETSQGEVFVTEWDGTYIKKYLPNGKYVNIAGTKHYNPFTKTYETQGLCVTSQDDLLVCLYKSGDSKVVRMSTTGHIKQTIQNDKQHKPLFTVPERVTENINGDVVVVNGFQTIVVVNKEGEYRYRYPDSSQSSHKFAWCEGIACDNTGCILISDKKKNRLHQLDINGRFIQFILTQQHGIKYPRGLSIDVKGQLWCCNDNGDEVIIFKYRS